ncbi:hypothetical protein LAC03_26780 [Levilactobacillus acidifarinae]|nr:hypothetical protein LAC03_26780 [Levilactobacillus acidifarinae]
MTTTSESRPAVNPKESLANQSNHKLMTIATTAKFLGISRDLVNQLLQDPGCPRMVFNNGGTIRIPQDLLLDYVKGRSLNWYKY